MYSRWSRFICRIIVLTLALGVVVLPVSICVLPPSLTSEYGFPNIYRNDQSIDISRIGRCTQRALFSQVRELLILSAALAVAIETIVFSKRTVVVQKVAVVESVADSEPPPPLLRTRSKSISCSSRDDEDGTFDLSSDSDDEFQRLAARRLMSKKSVSSLDLLRLPETANITQPETSALKNKSLKSPKLQQLHENWRVYDSTFGIVPQSVLKNWQRSDLRKERGDFKTTFDGFERTKDRTLSSLSDSIDSFDGAEMQVNRPGFLRSSSLSNISSLNHSNRNTINDDRISKVNFDNMSLLGDDNAISLKGLTSTTSPKESSINGNSVSNAQHFEKELSINEQNSNITQLSSIVTDLPSVSQQDTLVSPSRAKKPLPPIRNMRKSVNNDSQNGNVQILNSPMNSSEIDFQNRDVSFSETDAAIMLATN